MPFITAQLVSIVSHPFNTAITVTYLLIFSVKYAGFNLIATTILFITALILRQLSKTESEIPAPCWVNRFVALVNRFLRLPATTPADDNAKSNNATIQCQYSSLACTLNNILFVIFSIIYFVVVVACFVF